MFATNTPIYWFQDAHHKKVITTSLIVMVLVCSLFACLFVNDSTGTSLADAVHVKNEEELKNVINNASKATTIMLDKDITLTDTLKIPTDRDITLTSNKATGFYKLIGGCITVENGGVLKIDGIIVNSPWCGVIVDWGGTFYLYSGIISGNTASSRGVNNDGTFVMTGGTISGNTNTYGGGVYNSGTFKMSGGEITDNTATDSGGGIYNAYRGTIEMSGGKISDNTANYGGGVYIIYSEFILSGGEISDNIAYKNGGGVYNQAIFTMSGGTISNNKAVDGGGVYNRFSFIMSGGTISNNKASGWGGGVCHDGSGYYEGSGCAFSQQGGVIKENTATNGDNNIHITGYNGGGTTGDNENNSSDSNSNESSNGNNETNNNEQSIGSFRLRDILVICVIIVITLVIAIVTLFIYFQKRISKIEENNKPL